MTLEEYEVVDLGNAEGKALTKASRMAAYTINKIYEHHKDSDDRLSDMEIDSVKDAVQILTMSMSKERSKNSI